MFISSSLWQKAVQWRKDFFWLTLPRNEVHHGWEGMAEPVWSMHQWANRRGNDSCQQAFFPAHFLLTIGRPGCILPLQLDLTGNTLKDTTQDVLINTLHALNTIKMIIKAYHDTLYSSAYLQKWFHHIYLVSLLLHGGCLLVPGHLAPK